MKQLDERARASEGDNLMEQQKRSVDLIAPAHASTRVPGAVVQHTKGRLEVGGESFEWNSPSNPRTDIVYRVAYVEGVRPTQYLVAHVCYPTTTGDTVGAAERKANARRLVACWNACEGIPTDNLEPGGFLRMNRADNDMVRHLERDRSELLAALEHMIGAFEPIPMNADYYEFEKEAIERARAAVNAAKNPV